MSGYGKHYQFDSPHVLFCLNLNLFYLGTCSFNQFMFTERAGNGLSSVRSHVVATNEMFVMVVHACKLSVLC